MMTFAERHLNHRSPIDKRSLKRTLVASVGSAFLVALPALATDVYGTGNPAQDVANVQAAVDAGGIVYLHGNFDFTGQETNTSSPRVITVTGTVQIAGVETKDGLPSIHGGQTAFMVDAPGMDVTLNRLHFVGQTSSAVTIAAAAHAGVSRCVIDNVIPSFDPVAAQSVSWGINVSRPPPSGATVASLDIERNVIDMVATSTDNTLGIFVAGSVNTASIERNVVRNATAHAIDVRGIGDGVTADIEHNDVAVIASARSGNPGIPPAPDQLITGIRVLGVGNYSVLWNDVRIEHPNAAGIRMQNTSKPLAENNDIVMALSAAATPGSQSAGVQIIRNTMHARVCLNAVSGIARTGVSILAPADDTVIASMDDGDLEATFYDVEVASTPTATVTNTQIVGETGTISDMGTGTVITPKATGKPDYCAN